MAKPRAKIVQRRLSGSFPSAIGAVMYARVSTAEQEKEGFSIPAQQKLMREYADLNGFRLLPSTSTSETAKRAVGSDLRKCSDTSDRIQASERSSSKKPTGCTATSKIG